MAESWDRRAYPVVFQVCTESNLDNIELYGSLNNWSGPIARLSYAYKDSLSSQKEKYVYLLTVSLIPGEYEYKFKVNNSEKWLLNSKKKSRNNNNLLTKEDFIQLIVKRNDLLERARINEIMNESKFLQSINQNDDANTNINYCNTGVLLFKNPLLWDTELVVNKTQNYKTHRAILSVNSGYFKKLFTTKTSESPTIIQIQVDDSACFYNVLKFIYTGIVPKSLDHKQLKSLLILANTYEIPTLGETIKQILATKDIDVNNCLLLLTMKNELKEDWLQIRRKAIDIFAKNFAYLCHQDEFLKLQFDIIQDIFSDATIEIPNKTMGNMVLYRWIKANW